jgi:hypothetical protein
MAVMGKPLSQLPLEPTSKVGKRKGLPRFPALTIARKSKQPTTSQELMTDCLSQESCPFGFNRKCLSVLPPSLSKTQAEKGKRAKGLG